MAASLQTRVLYGLKTNIIGNAHYITDAEILYPVGNALAIHNIPQQQQKLIRLSDKHEVNIVCVASNKRYVALCEVNEKPTISIYDLQTLKRRKLLGIPYDAPGTVQFNCIDFTFDNKYLVAVTGEPDQTMLFYNWERGKVESSLKVGNSQNLPGSVNILSCNPSDSGVMAVGGPHVFKFLTLSDTVWRPYGFSKAENILTCSMTWLNADRLLVGTKDGRILYMENGDLKNIYKMSETVSMNLMIREEYIMQVTGSQINLGAESEETWVHNVLCLVSFQRGFAYALGIGIIIVFEKQGPHKYVKRNVYVTPSQAVKDENVNLYKVHAINVNPSSDRLLITTEWPQIFYATLWGPDLQVDPEPRKLKIMGQALHYGPITGLSMCAWKPVFMTFGEVDRSVRLWDFETESLIMFKQYAEDICSIALHPMGLFCLIGFTDKLRFMSILIDDLLLVQEFPIRNCKIVAFSYGGHMFAAVNGNIIQIYTTIGFSSYFLLKGHTGKVKVVIWSRTDIKLISIGTEGAIYEWDMSNGKRIGEMFIRGVTLHDIVANADASILYCIADNNRIYEIKENTIAREFVLPNVEIYNVLMDKNDLAILLTCSGGVILSLKCPLQEPIEYNSFHIHSVDITKMAFSYNEQYLVSTAMDGSLCIWKLYYPEGKGADKDLIYTNEVLIGKGDLEEKIKTIKNLTIRMRELETEHAYKMRHTEVQYNDKVRELHEGYCEAIQELKDNIDKLQEDRTHELNNINVEIVKMKTAHEEEIQQMENSYDAKLIAEYDKYQAFEERNTNMRQEYEDRFAKLEIQHVEEIEKTTTKYEALLHEKKIQLEEAQDEMMQQIRTQETLMMQIEDDADKEIVEVRTNYEKLLYEERQMNLRLKGEVGLMRNKYTASQKDGDDLKRQVYRVQHEYAQLQNAMKELEKDVSDLKKEIGERDSTIQDRERKIYDLKRITQELEKFKFVLNYKIDELKNQIEPRDQEIRDLKEKISDMEMELVNLHKTNVSLELQLRELREKLGAAQHAYYSEIQKNKECQQLLKKIRVDLFDTAGLIQDPLALKAAVKDLYQNYSADDAFLRIRKADLDAQCDFMKQRNHLEKTVMSLKKQVFHDTSGEGKDLKKMMTENITLISEINSLREELKSAHKHIIDMETLLGLTGKDIKPVEAREKLEKACYGYEELRKEYSIQIQDCYNIITSLKEDIRRLLSKVACQESEVKISFEEK